MDKEITSQKAEIAAGPLQPAAGVTPAMGGKGSAPRRYVVTLYARATEDEKRRIERRAAGAGLSVSRYLVRSGAEDRPPPTRDERTRLEDLLYLFKRAGLCLEHLTANAEALERMGAPAPLRTELREAARLLAALARGLTHRL